MYSYIGSVFPDYQNTTDTLYNKLYSQTNTPSFIPGQESFESTPYNYVSGGFTPKNKSNTLIDVTKPYYKSSENEVGGFYNRVAVERPETKSIEAFSPQEAKCDQECDDYIQHILKCSGCRQKLVSKLGMNSQYLFELLAYILFGIFVLMLIERL